MPAPVADVLVTPSVERIGLSLEPAQNVFHSLLLLAKKEEVVGYNDWVTETVLAMSAMERQRHQLVMIGFFFAVIPNRSWPSFPAYLEHLASLTPMELRDKLMEAYFNLPCHAYAPGPYIWPDDYDTVISSADKFLEFLVQRFRPDHIDPQLESQAYAYLVDPPSMHELILSHLNHMWETYLAAEWARVRPMLLDAVAAFEQVDYRHMSRMEAVEFITGQVPKEEHLLKAIEQAENLIFVPSAHVGPYLGKFKYGESVGIVFGARLPEGTLYYAPDLSRAEILVRLSALADDNRLRILRLIAEEGEKRSQEIKNELNLSQSAASRHLTQLSATGFLRERRCEGAKCYNLNMDRIDDTLRAVSAYLSGL
ncbi:MAG: winged helix-turn-helix domain-containing protein [Chloroflexota bacterium]|jgi:DNA-binding transcriptional ArsR family regulator